MPRGQNLSRSDRSKGGRSQGAHNNPGNFANDPQRAREAGRKGGQSSGSSSSTAGGGGT